MHPSHRHIYQHARAYDVAFGFRDISAECNTLTALSLRHARRSVTAVLELAAGPARHARDFARRGVVATALDSMPSMREYALERAARDGVGIEAVCTDMCGFQLTQRFDLAILLMDSSSYLLDNEAVLRHLGCVSRHLIEGGLYVLEMSHPRDVFGTGTSTASKWTAEEDGLRVETQWGADGDTFDPIKQVDEVTVTMAWSGPSGSGQLVEGAHQRRFTANEIDALVRADGNFDIVEWLGSLETDIPFGNEPSASRMVPVLRKKAAPA
jgi:SAM-dependent methyltransferase